MCVKYYILERKIYVFFEDPSYIQDMCACCSVLKYLT